MDHFALPADGLAIAARSGRLRRNFQGYTTDQADALIGLGASSIGLLAAGLRPEHAGDRRIRAARAAPARSPRCAA